MAGLEIGSRTATWANGLAIWLLAIVSLAAFGGALLTLIEASAEVISAGCDLLPGIRSCGR